MSDLRQELRWMLMVFCVIVFFVVFLAMLVSMWRLHKSELSELPNFHASVAVEICWALAPCVIVFLMVYPTVKAVLKV